MNDTDEWRVAVQESNAALRPEPDEYEGSADGPSNAVYSATDDVALGMRWGGDLICPSCQRNERKWWEAICRECQDERLAEEAHDHGRPGEWD